jgi:hypothetical protein
MSLRDHASNILDNLIASGIWSAVIVLAVKFLPRIVASFAALRVVISSLAAVLRSRLRATRAKIGQWTRVSQNTLIVPDPGMLPPGTASALAMAMQDLPHRPRILNNSHNANWQQVFAYQQQQLDAAARFALQTPMPRYNHALTPQPGYIGL